MTTRASDFSSSQSAHSSVAQCTAADPAAKGEACEVSRLVLERVAGGGSSADCSVEWLPDGPPAYRQSPARLAAGDTLQLVASSAAKGNEPRVVTARIERASTCSVEKHELVAVDVAGPRSTTAATFDEPLRFHRARGTLDATDLPDFFGMLRSAFVREGERFPVQAFACGVSTNPTAAAAASIAGTVEVFPADEYSIRLTLPAWKEPTRFNINERSAGWKPVTEREQAEADEARVKDAVRSAKSAYDVSSAKQRAAYGSRRSYLEYVESLERAEIEQESRERLLEKSLRNGEDSSGFEVELSSTDGVKTRTADPGKIVTLVRLLREAEYRFKQISSWIDGIQVGLGCSAKIDCQLFVVSLTGKWGWREAPGMHRVFMGLTGELAVDLLKLDVDVSAGWRMAGAADAYLTLAGSGTIRLKGALERKGPDDPWGKSFTPSGKVKITGRATGRGAWAITLIGEASMELESDLGGLTLFQEGGILGGRVVIRRSAFTVSYEASCAGIFSVGDEATLIEANPEFLVIPIN